jgi:hypothetical protein
MFKRLCSFSAIFFIALFAGIIYSAYASYVPFSISSGGNKQRLEWIRIQNNGTVSILAQSSTWVTGSAHAGTGLVTLSWSNIWSAAPSCTCTAIVGGRICAFSGGSPPSTTGVQVNTSNNAGDEDRNFDMTCVGPR